ncbi:MAG: hypothetical protein ACQ5SW_13645 [Sphaerochaetaceae bacterium]
MEHFYILRLSKELRRNLKTYRDSLYAQYGHPDFLSLEPCIILGPTSEKEQTPFVDCPSLPLTTENKSSYHQGMLYLPIPDNPFARLREQLGTTYPFDGIYLGTKETTLTVDPIRITDVRLAILTIQRDEDLMLWEFSAEKHLDSDRGR